MPPKKNYKPRNTSKTVSKKKRQEEERTHSRERCFNCGEVGHQLKKCPEQINKLAITQNARKFHQRGSGGDGENASGSRHKPRQPPPALAAVTASSDDTVTHILDLGSVILGRTYENNRDAVLRRASSVTNGIAVAGLVVPCLTINDADRILGLCSDNVGRVYTTVGLEPSSVPSKGLTEQFKDQVSRIVKDSNCIAVGPIGIDSVSKYAPSAKVQAVVLDYFCELAKEHQLPVLVAHTSSPDETVTALKKHVEDIGGTERLIVWDYVGTAKSLNAYQKLGSPPVAVCLTGRICPASDGEGEASPPIPDDVYRKLGRRQILFASGLSTATPQNIPDEHICSQPNEPSNLPYVISHYHDTLLRIAREDDEDPETVPDTASLGKSSFDFVNQLFRFGEPKRPSIAE